MTRGFLGETLVGDREESIERFEHHDLAPRRRHTLPSSRPMTPAPTTASFFGTLSKSSAPQLSTMFLPSNGMLFSSVGIEPRGEHDVFGASAFPSCRRAR